MVLKYECPKCERRFVDWGAEKLDFKCPDCIEKLECLGMGQDSQKRKPKLKRKSAKKKPAKKKKAAKK